MNIYVSLLLTTMRSGLRVRRDLVLENHALRHQLAVLTRAPAHRAGALPALSVASAAAGPLTPKTPASTLASRTADSGRKGLITYRNQRIL